MEEEERSGKRGWLIAKIAFTIIVAEVSLGGGFYAAVTCKESDWPENINLKEL